MVSFHGFIFREMEQFWGNLRYFFRNQKTLFEIIFLFIYAIEQLILVLLILIWPQYASISSGIFALVVITTISFEKICMESRYTFLRDNFMIQELENQKLRDEYAKIIEHNNELKGVLSGLSHCNNDKKYK